MASVRCYRKRMQNGDFASPALEREVVDESVVHLLQRDRVCMHLVHTTVTLPPRPPLAPRPAFRSRRRPPAAPMATTTAATAVSATSRRDTPAAAIRFLRFCLAVSNRVIPLHRAPTAVIYALQFLTGTMERGFLRKLTTPHKASTASARCWAASARACRVAWDIGWCHRGSADASEPCGVSCCGHDFGRRCTV